MRSGYACTTRVFPALSSSRAVSSRYAEPIRQPVEMKLVFLREVVNRAWCVRVLEPSAERLRSAEESRIELFDALRTKRDLLPRTLQFLYSSEKNSYSAINLKKKYKIL